MNTACCTGGLHRRFPVESRARYQRGEWATGRDSKAGHGGYTGHITFTAAGGETAKVIVEKDSEVKKWSLNFIKSRSI